MAEIGTMRVKSGLAEMLKGGVIMDVTTPSRRDRRGGGRVAVMALERVPADIRAEGGVARMADPDKIREIQEAVTIPVMAKAASATSSRRRSSRRSRSTTSTSRGADARRHRAPHRQVEVHVPFVCGCTNLGEALRGSPRARR
jgi:pyridoxal 5'-phosphate synthase pdxS subunit